MTFDEQSKESRTNKQIMDRYDSDIDLACGAIASLLRRHVDAKTVLWSGFANG